MRGLAGATVTVVYPTAPVVRDSTGAYHADLDTSGWTGPDDLLYVTEWAGTGNVAAL